MPPRDPPRPRPPPQWRPHQAPPTNSTSSPVNGHAAGDAPAGAAAAFTAAAAEELAPVERAPSRADAGGRRFPRSDRPARCRPRRGGPADLADAAGPPQMRGGDGNHGGQAGDLRPVAELRAFHEGRGVRGRPAAGTSGGRGNTLHAPSYLHAWWVAKHQPLASRGGCHMYPRARHSGHPPGRSCGGSRPRRQAREGGASKTACRPSGLAARRRVRLNGLSGRRRSVMCHFTMPRAWRPECQLHNQVRVLHADRLRGMQNDVSAEVVGDGHRARSVHPGEGSEACAQDAPDQNRYPRMRGAQD